MSHYIDELDAVDNSDAVDGPSHDPFEEILARFGESVVTEVKELALQMASEITRELLAYLLPETVKPGCETMIGRRVLAWAYVMHPEMLKASASEACVLKRVGATAEEVKHIIGHKRGTYRKALTDQERLLMEAAASKTETVEGPSLHSLCHDLGITAAALSPETAAFSRKFNLFSRAQAHDWRQVAETESSEDAHRATSPEPVDENPQQERDEGDGKNWSYN